MSRFTGPTPSAEPFPGRPPAPESGTGDDLPWNEPISPEEDVPETAEDVPDPMSLIV